MTANTNQPVQSTIALKPAPEISALPKPLYFDPQSPFWVLIGLAILFGQVKSLSK